MHRENSPLPSNQLAVYLAGTIKKGHELSTELYWTEIELDILRKALPEYDLAFLNPALRSDDLSVQSSVFGRDMLMVYCSDFVLVDLRQRRSIGVGSEMMWAKMNRIPLIAFAPKETHYRMTNASILGVHVDNWIHPFVESLSDYVADSLIEAASWIERCIRGETGPIKGPEFMSDAMRLYRATQYDCDLPMQEFVNNSESLKYRVMKMMVTSDPV